MNEAASHRMPIFELRFNELRGKRSQAEFAEFLGIARPTVGFYENGHRIPDACTLKQIAERTNVTTDYLVGLSDNKTPENTAIGKVTGLSDMAIETLSAVKENFSLNSIINFLLTDTELLESLMRYSFMPYNENARFVFNKNGSLSVTFEPEKLDDEENGLAVIPYKTLVSTTLMQDIEVQIQRFRDRIQSYCKAEVE